MANECIPYYEDGDELPCVANQAVTGKKFVQVCADREGTISAGSTPPPYTTDVGLDLTASGGRIQVSPPNGAGAQGAGKRCLGVASWDAATGQEVTIKRGNVLPVTCSAAITAGQEVEVAADGSVIPLAAGIPVGRAVATQPTVGGDAQILVYLT